MSDFNTENEEFDGSYVEDEGVDDSWMNVADREQIINKAAIEFINELTAIRTALSDNQQLTESISQLNSNTIEREQQLQTILLLLEQLTKSLSTENISRLLQIQKSFSTFAQKLEMFDQAINANIRQQQESRAQADQIYQNLNSGWRRLEDEVKTQRWIVGDIASLKNLAILSIGTGFSAAAFMIIGFKLFISS